MNFCPDCGDKLVGPKNFCARCGYDLRKLLDQKGGIKDAANPDLENGISNEQLLRKELEVFPEFKSLRNENEKNILPEDFNCPNCGIELELTVYERKQKSFTCPNCNSLVDLNKNKVEKNHSEDIKNLENADVAQTEAKTLPFPDEPKGVGGWLFLFGIILTFINPIITISNLLNSYNTVNQFFDTIPELETLFTIDLIFSIPLIFLAVFSGIQLLTSSQNALKYVKTFFAALGAYAIIILFIPNVLNLSERLLSALNEASIKQIIGIGTFISIWYTYLKKSKRVKNTFFNT